MTEEKTGFEILEKLEKETKVKPNKSKQETLAKLAELLTEAMADNESTEEIIARQQKISSLKDYS